MSERHACRLVGLSRDSYRHAPVASAQTMALKTKIVEIAHTTCCDRTSLASITNACTGCTRRPT